MARRFDLVDFLVSAAGAIVGVAIDVVDRDEAAAEVITVGVVNESTVVILADAKLAEFGGRYR